VSQNSTFFFTSYTLPLDMLGGLAKANMIEAKCPIFQ
jgi:hypothetical protein